MSLRIRLETLQAELDELRPTKVKGKGRATAPQTPTEEFVQPTSPVESVSPHHTWESMATLDPFSPVIANRPERQIGAPVTTTSSSTFAVNISVPPPVSDKAVDRGQIASTSQAPFQVVVRKKGTTPKTIPHLEKIMKAAHQPGNRAALLRVKALCREAHETPRAEKTDVQRYLLAKWTNPTWSDDNVESFSTPASIPTPRLDDTVEVHMAYFARHRDSLPRGIPRDARGNNLRCYLQAHRTVGLLRPEKVSDDRNPLTSSQRTQFKLMAAELFSDRTAYACFLERNRIAVAREKVYRSYSSPLQDATVEDVARHFATCGVSIAEAETELYPWALEYLSAMTH